MPSITVVLSTSLDAVLRQTATSRGRSTQDVVNTAVSQYLGSRDDGSNSAIRIGNIELDPARRLVRKNSVLVRLTPTEFDLLHYLMVHAGLPMTHARLLGAVWGVEYRGELEYLRNYIRQLRKKLEEDPAEPKYLLTDACYGYRFADVTVDSKRGLNQRPTESRSPKVRNCSSAIDRWTESRGDELPEEATA
jgi:DNA-binding response OmpR family regulator